jgi:uroporphyrinogen III methyltransferase/synthase
MNPKEQDGNNIQTGLPLRGKTVLVTRPKDQAEEFAQLLEKQGASIVFVPTIEIVPPTSWHQFDDAIKTVRSYDAIIFTSANGVREFFRALNDRGTASARNDLKGTEFYVVGARTGESLVAEGFSPIIPVGVDNVQQLAEVLVRKPVKGKRFLFPKGNLANEGLAETLRSNDAQVDEIVVYETVAPRDEDAKSIRQKLTEQSIDVIAFFSPSSVKNLLGVIPRELVTSKTIAVIGSTTEAAAKELGLSIQVVASRPTATDLVDAIVRYFKE